MWLRSRRGERVGGREDGGSDEGGLHDEKSL
jgi:hypothetical protein